MRILAIEDNEAVAYTLSEILAQQNYAVETAADGQAGLAMIEAFEYDLIILDVMLPKLNGIDLCRKVRSLGYSMPILLLTAKESHHDRAVGLDAGADDYMAKPFDAEELVARIRALLRRATASGQPLLEWGALQLDPSSAEVTYEQQLLSLTPKESALIELFLRNPQRVFSCSAILEHLWACEDAPGEEAVRTHIKGLRQKLKAAGAAADFVETVYGIGYRLKPFRSTQSTASSRQASDASRTEQQALALIAGVWQRYQPRIHEQVTVLEQATQALTHHAITPTLQEQARKEAHTLAGSLGTFGLHTGSQLAHQIEELLKDDRLLKSQEIRQLQQYVSTLHQQIEQASDQSLVPSVTSEDLVEDDRPVILIVDRTPFAPGIQTFIDQPYPFQIEIASTLKMARQKLDRFTPAAVLLNLELSESSDCFCFLDDLNRRFPPIPAIVLTNRTDLTQRVEVARRGGRFYLHQPATPEVILEAVTSVMARSTQAKVLVVDDDPSVLSVLRSLLEPWNLKVIPLSDPSQFWNALEASSPDLLILDVELPDLSGIELCQVVRNDLRWSQLPILFLTAHTDSATVTQVFSAGADDFVSKPIVAPELVTRILNRLERVKLLKQIAETDLLTGVMNRQKSTQILADFLDRAKQQDQPVALALLDLNQLSYINHHYGHDAGDAVLRQFGQQLRQVFQSEDVVSRWGGEEFVIGMYCMTQEEGIQRLNALLGLIQNAPFTTLEQVSVNATFCAGVAQYPEDGLEVRSLYLAAAAALHQAKQDRSTPILSTRSQKSLSLYLS